MTTKQILKRFEALKARQMKVRDEMRALLDDLNEHGENADEAADLLERAADAVSKLL